MKLQNWTYLVKPRPNFQPEFLMNFSARCRFVTDLRKTDISCKTKNFYQNIPFEFSSPTSNKLLAEFWGSTTKKKLFQS